MQKISTVRRRSGAFVLSAVVAAALQYSTNLASADPAPSTPYPVPYNFIFDAIPSTFNGASVSPPGTNNWTCKPTATHPAPVVLVHGILANRNNNWQTYGPLLANNGYCVFALNYGNDNGGSSEGIVGGLASMRDSAQALGVFVDRVLAATGANKVAIVGHSEGATMPHWYIKHGGASKVSTMVSLASLVHGVGDTTGSAAETSANSGSSSGSSDGAFAEFAASSSFVRELNQGGITMPGVAYTQIVTRYDELVTPYTSGLIDEPGAVNVTVQDLCYQDLADHLALVSDPVAARVVLNALDPAHTQPVPCTLVLPVVGALGTGSGGSSESSDSSGSGGSS